MGIEMRSDLPYCPVCGKICFIAQDMPGKNDCGWSVGCSAYTNDDGIHKKKMIKYNLNTMQECELWWKTICGER